MALLGKRRSKQQGYERTRSMPVAPREMQTTAAIHA